MSHTDPHLDPGGACTCSCPECLDLGTLRCCCPACLCQRRPRATP